MRLIKYISALFLIVYIMPVLSDSVLFKEKADNAFKTRKFKDANIEYRRALRESPDDTEALVGIALTEEILTHYKDAMKFATKAMNTDPANITPYLILGRLYVQQGKLFQARIAYHSALEIEPDNFEAIVGLGQLAQIIGNDAGASDYYDTLKKTKNKRTGKGER